MSKESATGMDCLGCGRRIQFMENHLRHCTSGATAKRAPTISARALTARVARELHVPQVADQKIANKRGRVRP